MSERISIARASYLAYVDKDRSRLESLIADDFHFTSPLDNRIDRKTYFQRCWPNSQTVEDFQFLHAVEDGETVFITYEGRRGDGTRFRNTEILTISDDRITEVEVYFGWNIPHKAKQGGFVGDAKP